MAMIAALAEGGRVEPIPTTTKRHGLLYEYLFCRPKTTTDTRAVGQPINYFSQSALLIQDYGIKAIIFDNSNLDKFGFRELGALSILGQ
jgi:hypothetical protein